MTVGEFIQLTSQLDPNIELKFHFAGGNYPITTFDAIGKSLVLCSCSYGIENTESIIKAIVKLKNK